MVHTWCAKKGHHRYYTQSTKLGKYLHNLIFPKWKIVDHINRDGLDNRRCNLRDGNKDNINVKNQKRKDNAFGKTGVHFSNYKNGAWVVQWPENEKRKKKTFSIGKYGMEGAKQKAIQFRVEVDKRLNLSNGYDIDCEDREEQFPEQEIKPHTPKLFSTNTSGIHGVRFNGKAWVVYWWDENKNRKSKTFSLKTYGEEAKELAIQTRLNGDSRIRH